MKYLKVSECFPKPAWVTFILLIPLITFSQLSDTNLNKNTDSLFIGFFTYDSDRNNLVTERKEVPISLGEEIINVKESTWKINVHKEAFPSMEGANEYTVNFECLDGELNNASVSAGLMNNSWSKENYLLMPAAAYNGNRYPSIKMNYMPFWNDPSQLGTNKPILLSDQPRLNHGSGYSAIHDRSGSVSIPAVGYFSPSGQEGTWIFFDQGNEWGDYGVSIEENKNRDKAYISLSSPVVREKTKYFIANNTAPSYDFPATFIKGDKLAISFIIQHFECENVQDLYDMLYEVRPVLFPTPEKVKVLPFSAAFKIQQEKFNRENWREAGYYGVGVTDHFFQDWQIGWTGGMISTLPLLIEGDELSQKRAMENFNWLEKNGVSSSGYYWDIIYQGKPSGAFPQKALGDSLHLNRKNADATYYIFKQFMLMEKMGIQVKPGWVEMNLKALEAQIKTWIDFGQLGQFVNQYTGDVVIGNSTSAGIFPASLCLAYQYTGNEKYLDFAFEIMEYYYHNFIQNGLSCGGPGDAMQSFDSESAYGLLESLAELYETTGDQKWLRFSEEMAKQFATWIVGYDFKFPESSLYHSLDIRTTGAVYANTQNKHAAPGICTHSGIALLKIYRATGNKFYLELLRDIAHTLPQFLATKDRPIKGLGEGWSSERVNMTDWLEGIGETFYGSTWAETSLMLTYAELPGVYVNIDEDYVVELDHVNAKIIKKTGKGILLEIHNPTKYDATIKVFAENSKQAAEMLGNTACRDWIRVNVRANERKNVFIKTKK